MDQSGTRRQVKRAPMYFTLFIINIFGHTTVNNSLYKFSPNLKSFDFLKSEMCNYFWSKHVAYKVGTVQVDSQL